MADDPAFNRTDTNCSYKISGIPEHELRGPLVSQPSYHSLVLQSNFDYPDFFSGPNFFMIIN